MPRRAADPLPHVTLTDPPAVSAGAEAEIEVTLSWAVNVASRIECRREGEVVASARLRASSGRRVRMSLPALEPCTLRLEVKRGGAGRGTNALHSSPVHMTTPEAPYVLVVPGEAAQEMCQLFGRMAARKRARGASGQADILYSPPAGSSSQSTQRPPLEAAIEDDQKLPESVWQQHFSPLCCDLSTLLDGLSSGSKDSHEACMPMAAYLLENHLWGAASYLLNRCLSLGVPVTLGPFALLPADVQVDCLRRNFASIERCQVGLWVGRTVDIGGVS
eukprot:evm.model.scf_96.9 EVM.evm.TU.scf_96.9   scf_96:130591-134962(-)